MPSYESDYCSCGSKKDPKRTMCEECIKDLVEERLDRNRFNARRDEILRAKRKRSITK